MYFFTEMPLFALVAAICFAQNFILRESWKLKPESLIYGELLCSFSWRFLLYVMKFLKYSFTFKVQLMNTSARLKMVQNCLLTVPILLHNQECYRA